MAALQVSSFLCSSTTTKRSLVITKAAINVPKISLNSLSLPKLQNRAKFVEDLEYLRSGYNTKNTTTTTTNHIEKNNNTCDPIVIAKLYAIMEAVADRVEMHKNICEQRNNWNSLLLSSVNMITLASAGMVGLAASTNAHLLALNASSSLMYLAVTGMLVIMNKIQPSQLAEEQRNAVRLCKQLYGQIQTLVAIGSPTQRDVEDCMEKVLAIDRAFPLPLLGAMLEKFPETVEPTVWWPKQRRNNAPNARGNGENGNGWDEDLENELHEIASVLSKNDKADYLRLGEKALKINKVLAVSGPILTGLAAVGSAFAGSSSVGAAVGIIGGALASVVNTLEHGGQVGMVVELYRSNAGFFKQMEEFIEHNLSEKDSERRENGELFEMKLALYLGRSVSELRDLATKSKREGKEMEEFGSKLF